MPTKSQKKNAITTVDYGKRIPDWVRDAINEHIGQDIEDAKQAGALGFMARALVMATMPYKDPKSDSFVRKNGDFTLRILAGYEGGIPYGVYPRLLMSWVATEAVRKQSPIIELGDSLTMFLREVMELRRSGGSRGTHTRVAEQMKRLFGSLITAKYSGNLADSKPAFSLQNVLIADRLDLDLQQWGENDETAALWHPQPQTEAGQWRSQVKLSDNFYNECIERPVPIDLRAYKALRGSPLAMDVYTWLTYRMSYTERETRPIPWASLMLQFGSNFTTDQAVRDFKKAFLKALKAVVIVYPQAQVDVRDNGLVLIPSPTSVAKLNMQQQELF